MKFRNPKAFDRLKASPQCLGIHDIVEIQLMNQFKHTFDILVVDTGKCLIQCNNSGMIFIVCLFILCIYRSEQRHIHGHCFFASAIVDACERSISAVLNDNAVVLADTIVQKVLAPLLTPVISLVLFFVAFALLRMLVSLLVTVLGLVNKLPVIGAVNHWLGWGVGGIASLVDIYLVLCVVWALIVITGGNLTMLNDTVMSGSLYYKVFNVFNPFV